MVSSEPRYRILVQLQHHKLTWVKVVKSTNVKQTWALNPDLADLDIILYFCLIGRSMVLKVLEFGLWTGLGLAILIFL